MILLWGREGYFPDQLLSLSQRGECFRWRLSAIYLADLTASTSLRFLYFIREIGVIAIERKNIIIFFWTFSGFGTKLFQRPERKFFLYDESPRL